MLAGSVLGGTAVLAAPPVQQLPAPARVAPPVLTAAEVSATGRVRWDKPLRLLATGALNRVVVVDPDGQRLAGRLAGSTWTSDATLYPGATYRVQALAQDGAGQARRIPLEVRTTPADRLMRVTLSPGDGALVGVGMPVSARFDRPVTGTAARALVEQRLSVTTTPAVTGAWRWMSDTEAHWRGATYWPAGTTVRVSADLHRLALPGGVWGSGRRTTQWRVGAALVSTVDVTRKTMTVRRDGKVVRVMKASMGRPEFPTRGGRHIVLEKNPVRVMDSATVGLPRGSAGYYRTRVEWAVRLTYSGTFTHSAPWSVRHQGVRNVSHGCINLSPADARWYFDATRRGDVVEVVGTKVPPRSYDPGTADWNMSFDTWRAGSALR